MSKYRVIPFKQSPDHPALRRQSYIGRSLCYNFPFTINPIRGDLWACPFECHYCYTQLRSKKSHDVQFKPWLPDLLDSELELYSEIPQHMKRVQINEAFEYYIPFIMAATKNYSGEDLLIRILRIFEKHWNNGNKWMLHLLTKSPHILDHLGIIQELKHMIQIEVSISCLNDDKRNLIAPNAPSVPSRFNTIKRLSDAGIFVRVMAMPFCGDMDTHEENISDAFKLREEVLNSGAKAFKHKELNYGTWDDVIETGKLIPDGSGQHNTTYDEILLKSGETNIPDIESGVPVRLCRVPLRMWSNGDVHKQVEELTTPDIVSRKDLASITNNPEKLFSCLINRGYINENGILQDNLKFQIIPLIIEYPPYPYTGDLVIPIIVDHDRTPVEYKPFELEKEFTSAQDTIKKALSEKISDKLIPLADYGYTEMNTGVDWVYIL